MSLAPGVIRDSIIEYLQAAGGEASTSEVLEGVARRVGDVPASSVRSYLSLNTPAVFTRVGRGRYRLGAHPPAKSNASKAPTTTIGQARLINADCFAWLAGQPPCTVHAVVTDPPYGLVEYTEKETQKLRAGKGGVWRVPPAFDGHRRAPLPRFTTLDAKALEDLFAFFLKLGVHLNRVCVPGANVVVASNPLLSHIVATALSQGGLELRGYLARQVMTMRGGDRPKNAHKEFAAVSVMPRSQWEPWVVLRRPLEGRVQDNLRRWKTGGFRRPSDQQPFGDVIRSGPTSSRERSISPHPSLKPQDFMRQVVRGVLPLGEGVVLDPFMGGGSTLAAANAVGYDSIGIEKDAEFYAMARAGIPKLSKLG